jgi:hypothetical protein
MIKNQILLFIGYSFAFILIGAKMFLGNQLVNVELKTGVSKISSISNIRADVMSHRP